MWRILYNQFFFDSAYGVAKPQVTAHPSLVESFKLRVPLRFDENEFFFGASKLFESVLFLKTFRMNHITHTLIRKNQNLSKPEDSLKVWGGPTTTPPSIHLGSSRRHLFHLVPFRGGRRLWQKCWRRTRRWKSCTWPATTSAPAARRRLARAVGG